MASRLIRRRSGFRPLGLEQLEARQLLTAKLGLASAPIYDTPTLPLSWPIVENVIRLEH